MTRKIDKVNQSASHNTAAEEDVLDLVHTVMHQYRSQQYQVLRGGPHDITHMESKVLSFFARHPGATQSRLAEHSGRDKAQLARLVKGLRARELLAGEADPADRRNLRLALTSDGQVVLRTLRQQARRLAAQAVAGMTPAQQRELMTLLRKVRENLSHGEP
ncbi:MAG: MarR family transcriptional regulator [Burkholderiales bacterium]|jgi:DNA-binding MarR family transcriptional regulator|nr:MarR family transcriptional regulator [Burkholderiales bacterium]MCA3219543.1 MarR family transcriptional regulator [Burkholderiales bacterium]MCA3227339.1 MarR family transcriptional regulator [Burkholderiales bacterium]MCZ8176025.1 MarR family transcriptional regulator [Burkholderiaceae bacterium]